MEYRLERDSLGEVNVPADAHYGAQTARAVENYPISGLRAHAELVTATIRVKKAAAEASLALGRLDADVARAVIRAAEGSSAGGCAISSSSTSTRPARALRTTMNANEVLANRASELLERSTATATALSPHIGYAATADLAKEAVRSGRTIRELVLERGLLDRDRLDRILSADAMTRGGVVDE